MSVSADCVWGVSMPVCVCTYIHTYVCTYICVYISNCLCEHLCAYVKWVYSMCVHVHVYKCMLCVSVCLYVHMYCLSNPLTVPPAIPHFKEVIVMALTCDTCGYRSNEVKSGARVSEKGTRITLHLTDPIDLSGDILKVRRVTHCYLSNQTTHLLEMSSQTTHL